MIVCPSCGQETPEGFPRCAVCGASLATEAETSHEVRKTVTVVFCDVTGSTALGERLDPESLRRVMARYFEQARLVFERHGGTVEKFIGDAVMAVFGIPLVHEDDALRAVRAAWELRETIARLNEELKSRYGVTIAVRTGVNTGEVVSGTEERLATGDAVNVAARLEQAALPDQILLGEQTYRLVRDAVRAEPVEPLPLRGKAEPVAARQLLKLLDDVPAFTRPLHAPFVGRDEELETLRRAFWRAVEERSCQVCTVAGPPGIGKSRLARELVTATHDEARVVVGRCLPYGEGITYWPLAEIVRQVGGEEPISVVGGLLAGREGGEAAVRQIAAVLGVGDAPTTPEEIAWAFRKLLEALARERPLVCVLDDIHWAEPGLLDLLEYLVSFSSGAPILLLCLARPELFEARPSWATPRASATLISLRPLPDGDAMELLEQLVARRRFSADAQGRVLAAAEGNPLFVEQMVAMLSEDEQRAAISLPPTLQALLAARIDALESDERAIIERAAIEGRMFHRGAVVELLPPPARAAAAGHLMTLVRKELIRPDRGRFAGDDGFRFAHVLIRDAAYEATAKELRAELHERYASWLERKTEEAGGTEDAILGFHLEQAYQYRRDLGPVHEREQTLAVRAGERLARAGARALGRSDMPAARNLLERAAGLLEYDPRLRAFALADLARSLIDLAQLADARRVVQELRETAGELGDPGLQARALLETTRLASGGGETLAPDRLEEDARRLLPALEQRADDAGLACAYQVLADAEARRQRLQAEEGMLLAGLEHARRAGDPLRVQDILFYLLSNPTYGAVPIPEAIERCERIRELAERGGEVELRVLRHLGQLYAKLGRFNEARELVEQGRRPLLELGLDVGYATTAGAAAVVELLAGASETAERVLREAHAALEQMPEPQPRALVIVATELAEVLLAEGQESEVIALTEVVERIHPNLLLWRLLRAVALARRGDVEAAEALARPAVEHLTQRTDRLDARGDALTYFAEILRLAGKHVEARGALEEALKAYEQREHRIGAARTRALLAERGAVA